jgi:predicted enzyme related to lactoylglutathione lyase
MHQPHVMRRRDSAASVDVQQLQSRPMITESLFEIAVPDLERSAAFYRDVLGFTVTKLGDYGWRMFARNNCKIMAGECPDAIPASAIGDHSYFAYLVVDDVDACYGRVRGSSTELVKDLRDEPWGMREFGLRTVDGHRIMLGSRIGPK